jgi:hypothetical protein
MRLSEEFKKEILNDPYFSELLNKAELIAGCRLFKTKEVADLDSKELRDLLRFADILSHTEDSDSRNLSYKIISLLVQDFGQTKEFAVFAHAILSKLGNFPALKFLQVNEGRLSGLPLEREIEETVKKNEQKTSDSKYIFTDAQYKIRQSLEKFDYFSFSGPTSLGKSFIVKDFIRHILQEEIDIDGALVILVPTRALIAQVVNDLRKEINRSDINIASHPVTSNYALNRYKHHIFVFTPERLLSFVANGNLNIQFLFVDEAQKVVAPNDARSSLYYHAIYETTKRFASKIVFAAPNIPNPDIFLRLFEKSELGTISTNEQTVAQNRYLVDFTERKLISFSDLGVEINHKNFIDFKSTNELLVGIGNTVNNIIYCNGIGETVQRAKAFAHTLPPIKEDMDFRDLISFIADYVHKDYYLIECLRKGVAFHHGKMPQKIRKMIEDYFNDAASPLKYIFCTSTLLEGVNMPAKNIFVLNDRHGSQIFEKIDFENLIGRAGRLTKEFSGNVICVKEDPKRWKDSEALIEKVPLVPVESFLLNRQRAKKKEFTNIAMALENKEMSKTLRVGEKQNLIHYASIMLIHEIEGANSLLRTGFLEKTKDASTILRETSEKNRVPPEIIKMSSTIKPFYQNRALEYIERMGADALLNLYTDDQSVLLHALETLYDLYGWDIEESQGRDPLIPKGLVNNDFGKARLKYWGMLLKNWTRAEPLSRLITFSIKYHTDRGVIWFKEEGRWTNEKFTGSQKQINIIIEQIMNDIEQGLRFTIEKYFLNFYLLSKHVLGDKAGPNWAEFIEYGTLNRKSIELQNVGFSRGASSYLLKQHGDCFAFNELEQLVGIMEEKLFNKYDKKEEYYSEVMEILNTPLT